MSCKYCRRTIYTRENDYSNSAVSKHYNKEKPNYCFECGTPLTEPEPLSWEELRKMKSEVVWIHWLVEPAGGWEDGRAIVGKYHCPIPNCEGDWNYGIKWIAYSHKPKTQPAPKKGGI